MIQSIKTYSAISQIWVSPTFPTGHFTPSSYTTMTQETMKILDLPFQEEVQILLWNKSIVDQNDKTNDCDKPEMKRVDRFEPFPTFSKIEGSRRRKVLQSQKYDMTETTSFWLSDGSDDGNKKDVLSPTTLQEKLCPETRIISAKERIVKNHGGRLRKTLAYSGDSMIEVIDDFEDMGTSPPTHRNVECTPVSTKHFDHTTTGMCERPRYKDVYVKTPKRLGSPEENNSSLTIDCKDLMASTTAGLMFLGTDEIGEFQLEPFSEDEFENDAQNPSTPSNRGYIRKLITKIISPRHSPSGVDDERQLACYWAFVEKRMNHREHDNSCDGEDEIFSIDQDMTLDKPLLQDQVTMNNDTRNGEEQEEEFGRTQENGSKWWSGFARKNDTSPRSRQLPQTPRVPVFKSIPSLSHAGHHMAISFKKELHTPRQTPGKNVCVEFKSPHDRVLKSITNVSQAGHDLASSCRNEFISPRKC